MVKKTSRRNFLGFLATTTLSLPLRAKAAPLIETNVSNIHSDTSCSPLKEQSLVLSENSFSSYLYGRSQGLVVAREVPNLAISSSILPILSPDRFFYVSGSLMGFVGEIRSLFFSTNRRLFGSFADFSNGGLARKFVNLFEPKGSAKIKRRGQDRAIVFSVNSYEENGGAYRLSSYKLLVGTYHSKPFIYVKNRNRLYDMSLLNQLDQISRNYFGTDFTPLLLKGAHFLISRTHSLEFYNPDAISIVSFENQVTIPDCSLSVSYKKDCVVLVPTFDGIYPTLASKSPQLRNIDNADSRALGLLIVLDHETVSSAAVLVDVV